MHEPMNDKAPTHGSAWYRTVRPLLDLPLLIATLGVAACAMPGSGGPRPAAGGPGEPPSGTAQPPPGPGRPPAAAPRQFHLGAATSALVAQAHRQAAGGDYGQADATLERAVRIEPDNPLVWIELGRVRLGESNAVQADALGHKALTLATGDPAAQAAAWRLIADSARARGRNIDAYDADRRAQELSAQ
jgi:tetratricopeptide (TPR) repeat protein